MRRKIYFTGFWSEVYPVLVKSVVPRFALKGALWELKIILSYMKKDGERVKIREQIEKSILRLSKLDEKYRALDSFVDTKRRRPRKYRAYDPKKPGWNIVPSLDDSDTHVDE